VTFSEAPLRRVWSSADAGVSGLAGDGTNPEGLKAAGLKDAPSRGDKEKLRLELELIPGWAPGRSMKPPRPAAMTLAPN
jgi:hypothetical protein